ncbi:MAG: hypothetical protein SF123_17350 [Chloroflexota bacterium]|nr:hypothetical protein [Chloroflexota bacterium]
MDKFFPADDSQFWLEPDYLLSLLVSFTANKLNAEFGITLMVGGTIMTGTLVSERAYLQRLNELFQTIVKNSLTNPTADDMAILEDTFGFEDMAEDYYFESTDDAKEDEDDFDEDSAFPPIRHLHLRDPYVLYPGSAMSFGESPLPVIRLRLTAVNGWMPGRVNVVDGMDDDFEPPFPGNRIKQ